MPAVPPWLAHQQARQQAQTAEDAAVEEALAAQEAEELAEDQTSSHTPGVSTSMSYMTTGPVTLTQATS
jgi:hypothetical protein